MLTQDLITDILLDARGRILFREQWTCFTSARDRAGKLVRYNSPEAARWCSEGSLSLSCDIAGIEFIDQCIVVDYLSRGAFAWCEENSRKRTLPSGVNDKYGHQPSLDMYDLAIRLSKEQVLNA